ncbi:MAG: type II toxin-antitoxin system HicB family antitoxin [Nanoarchaeota archaeon]|nr:type II toxin-antitoxin system HicB family antitoxin [Nanoarchaeota archaeon]
MIEFNVLLEKDEDGFIVARVPELDGCYTQGKTLEEVMERIKEAIEVCLEGDREDVSPMQFVGIQRISVKRPVGVNEVA